MRVVANRDEYLLGAGIAQQRTQVMRFVDIQAIDGCTVQGLVIVEKGDRLVFTALAQQPGQFYTLLPGAEDDYRLFRRHAGLALQVSARGKSCTADVEKRQHAEDERHRPR